jgi:hypothetical protein
MTTPAQTLLDYRCGTKRWGRSVLFWGLFVPIVLIAAINLFPAELRQDKPVFYCMFHALAILIGAAVVFGIAIPNLRMDRQFRFRITDDAIECECPAKAYGETFSVSIRDIVTLECDSSGDTPDWYLHTRDGRRVKITPNYNNPVRKIVATLQQLRPCLPERRT